MSGKIKGYPTMKTLATFLSFVLILTSIVQARPIPEAAPLVPIGELRDQVSAQTAERASNIREVQTLLRHQEVQERLGHLFELEKLAAAVPKMDDETLARLARESKQMNEQFKAGNDAVIWGLAIAAIVVIAIYVVYLLILKQAEDTVERVFG